MDCVTFPLPLISNYCLYCCRWRYIDLEWGRAVERDSATWLAE